MHPKCTTVQQTCANCGRQFPVKAYRLAIDQGRYCSSACYGRHFHFTTRPVETRFWEKVDRNGPLPASRPELGPCWLWTGAANPHGYGQLTVGSTRDGNRRREIAPRLAYRLHHGTLPADMDVLHHCDTPRCVNPDHLFLGTAGDNMRDASTKGRTTQGEKNLRARLTDAQVLEIRRRYATGDVTYDQLAVTYGVHVRTIGMAVSRKTWRHL